MITRYETRYSVYDISSTEDGLFVRRVEGAKPPTSRVGEDGVWKRAKSAYITELGLFIVWGADNAFAQTTVTSEVVGISVLDDPASS